MLLLFLSHQRTVPNEDFCQVCQGKGRFICCDGCPHSFHLTCLDPPMDESNVPDKDSLWFCKECHLAQVRGLLCRRLESKRLTRHPPPLPF